MPAAPAVPRPGPAGLHLPKSPSVPRWTWPHGSRPPPGVHKRVPLSSRPRPPLGRSSSGPTDRGRGDSGHPCSERPAARPPRSPRVAPRLTGLRLRGALQEGGTVRDLLAIWGLAGNRRPHDVSGERVADLPAPG